MTTQVGFVTMAFGAQRYLDQAIALAQSFRMHMPARKFCLITDKEMESPLFDDVVVMDPTGVPGVVLKTHLYDYTPYEESFFIDSDCIVVRDFSDHVEAIRAWDFSPVCNSYLHAADSDLWLRDVGEAIAGVGGTKFPKFNGGIYFFRKSEFAAAVFGNARALLDRKEELGILDFDSGGANEETLIGLALAEAGVDILYDDEGGLMRTPLNSNGPIEVDPIGGSSGFVKNGKRVSPAIVHFCGPYAKHPSYLIARKELERGKKASAVEKMSEYVKWKSNKLLAKYI